MRVFKHIAGLVALLIISVQVWSNEPRFRLGLYVVVDDMAESKDFYQKVFEAKPYVDNGDFVGFSVSGNLFALYSKNSFDHSLVRGNGVVPYIRVNDIDKQFDRVKALGADLVHEKVLEEGPIKLFMFMDPSGNPLEFYSLVAQ